MEGILEVIRECVVPFDRFCRDVECLCVLFLGCRMEGLIDNTVGQIFLSGIVGGIWEVEIMLIGSGIVVFNDGDMRKEFVEIEDWVNRGSSLSTDSDLTLIISIDGVLSNSWFCWWIGLSTDRRLWKVSTLGEKHNEEKKR